MRHLDFDKLRLGMSFRDEVRLLVALQLDLEPASVALPRLESVAPLEDSEREKLIASLQDDLIRAPLVAPRHREWVEAELADLPMWARLPTSTGPAQITDTPWLRADRPVLSARLSRLEKLEVGSLPLLESQIQNQIFELAADKALVHFFGSLGSRERLSYMAALDGSRKAELARLLSEASTTAEHTLQLSVLAAFKDGFTRAARSARDGVHLFARFSRFLVASALSGRYRVEARALMQSRSLRTSRRLEKALKRQRHTQTVVAEAALRSVRDALAHQSQLDKRSPVEGGPAG